MGDINRQRLPRHFIESFGWKSEIQMLAKCQQKAAKVCDKGVHFHQYKSVFI
jgi:hypothetical protein